MRPGFEATLGVRPCALALSTSANACLGSQGIWATPVPLGLAVASGLLAFVLGVLLVLSTQALCCSCYVTCKLVLAGAFALRQPVVQGSVVAPPQIDNDAAKTWKKEASGPEGRGRGVLKLRRGGGTLA